MKVKTSYLIIALALAALIVGSAALIKFVKDIPKGHFFDWLINRVEIHKTKSGDVKI